MACSKLKYPYPWELIQAGLHLVAINKDLFPELDSKAIETLLQVANGLPADFYRLPKDKSPPSPLSESVPGNFWESKEDPYVMIRKVFLTLPQGKPPNMSDEVYKRVKRIIQRLPAGKPVSFKLIPTATEFYGRTHKAVVGGKSGGAAGVTVGAGGAGAAAAGGASASSALMMVGPAAGVGVLVGAGTAMLIHHTDMIDKKHEKVAIGGSSGSSSGAVIGAVFGGPFGAAIGAAIGGPVGGALWHYFG